MFAVKLLGENLQKVAIEELNEVPSRVPKDIEDLRNWILKQPHLKARTDDQFLLIFLRGCKFSLEKAKSKIDRFYTLKTKHPELFTTQTMDKQTVHEILKLDTFVSLPRPLNGTGPRIQYIRFGAYPPDKYTFTQVISVYHTCQELAAREDDYSVVNGYIQLLDTSSLTYSHIVQITPLIVKKMITFAEDAVPTRLRTMHCVNVSTVYDKLFNMIKHVLPEKFQQRLYVHSSLNSLFEHIPEEYLPHELGGKNGSIEELQHQGYRRFLEFENYLQDDLNYRNNENLRTNELRDYDELFGLDGTFRKLDID
uniref:CRAL-TRIO domain-containing protein n=1 Tax=Glossina brevipalpis TaxID=37001 RepID=A0A1A9W9W0_9MUSC